MVLQLKLANLKRLWNSLHNKKIKFIVNQERFNLVYEKNIFTSSDFIYQ